MSSDAKHTVTAFDTDLDGLRGDLLEMGNLARQIFATSVEALMSGDERRATLAIALDASIDSLERRVEERAVLIIAKRQPLAVDLRDIMAGVRIASDLERIGDLSKNIAKRARSLGSVSLPDELAGRIDAMATLAAGQLARVMDAYATKNADEAIMIRNGDGEIDTLNTEFFRCSIDYLGRRHGDIAGIAHLIFCAKNIERIGDHVTNISENVYFIASGSMPEGERPKHDRSSGLD